MSWKNRLYAHIAPITPNYIGEEVIGELNNHIYDGTVIEKRGEGLYLIETIEGYKHLVRNIRRKCDFGRRQ